MKVFMLPTLESQKRHEGGIRRVLEAYHRYAPEFGVEFVSPGADCDLRVVHAGATTETCDVACLHGMYWTADYNATEAQHRINNRIVTSLRWAKEVTVPSAWVAEAFQRDMRFTPHVIPHGIDWQEWQHRKKNEGYILWNKNRAGDVCDPGPVGVLAGRFPARKFLTTFAPHEAPPNVKTTGLVPHAEMKVMIQRAGVYMSTTKETFCIGNLEAMASGVPVLGWAYGGNLDLIEHGVNGYLARPADNEDLARGLDYCLQHRQVLGANGREMAKAWTWQAAVEKLVGVFELATVEESPTVAVVIPVFNKSKLEIVRAIKSAMRQSYRHLTQIVVVDDGSEDANHVAGICKELGDKRIHFIRQPNRGVAHARNRGIAESQSKYVCCLDADDWLEKDFLKVCVRALERDRSLGIAYTGMRTHRPDGTQSIGRWPGQADADRQAERDPQVPTCNVFRRKVWRRLGGYRQRYAPKGAGAEDAELWLRMMAYGWRAEEVTSEPLFNYSWLSGLVSGNPNYREVDWTAWHPWTKDKSYPLAAVMRPTGLSHMVRQYDEPMVSVVIPVGKGHEGTVIDALDSLEAQTFRKWEAVVVNDVVDSDSPYGTVAKGWLDGLKVAYPYLREVHTSGGRGAGYARNRGVEIARAPFLVFLDADDWLHPEALEKMLRAWDSFQSVIYTDYMGRLTPIEPEEAQGARQAKRLIMYDEDKKEAWIKYQSYDFDCERALVQPKKPVPYLWCITTCLVPRAWHQEIGGFDEVMESWEDADYAYRLVRAGHCYARIVDELVMVRFYTGQRRDRGLQIHESLVEYMQHKYEGSQSVAGCGGCGSNRRVTVSRSAAGKAGIDPKQVDILPDEEMVLITYMSKNRGQHLVVGSVINPLTGKKFKYGRRAGGDTFLVHRDDVYQIDRHGQPTLRAPKKFKPVEEKRPKKVPTAAPQAPPQPRPLGEEEVMPEPEHIPTTDKIARWKGSSWEKVALKPVEGIPALMGADGADVAMEDIMPTSEPMKWAMQPFNFQTLPGVTAGIARQFEEMGLTDAADVLALGVEGLQEIRCIVENRAQQIIDYLEMKGNG